MHNIKIENMTFSYIDQLVPLFKNVNLDISTDWKLGLIGRNGQGKTTLLKLISGKLSPVKGSISNHKVNFQYFPIKIISPNLPTIMAIQEVYLIEEWELKKELSKLCPNVDDLIWRPYAQLSGGEQTKVQLAALFKDSTTYPLIDEPTNHLDRQTRQQIIKYLKHQKQGFIVVSHDVHFLNQIVDHILSIERTQILQFHGNYQTYIHEKKLKDKIYYEQNRKLKNEIQHLKYTANEKKNWSLKRESDNYGNPHIKGSGGTGHAGVTSARAKRMMKRSKAIEKRITNKIEQKKHLLNDVVETSPLDINYIEPSSKTELLRLDKFSLQYNESQVLLFQPISLNLKSNQQALITGLNGTGKSTLFKYLLGKNNMNLKYKGEYSFNKNIQVSYLEQIPRNYGSLKQFAAKNKLNYEQLLNQLRKLGMKRTTFDTPIQKMSKGQQKKVALAKSLVEPANLYLWDEPLNYLDIEDQGQIIDLIKKYHPTMLVIEHDQQFINEFQNHEVMLKRNCND